MSGKSSASNRSVSHLVSGVVDVWATVSGRRRRQRAVQLNLPLEQLMATVSGGQRLEILRVLTPRPLCVSAIAKALFMKVNAVSNDLAVLEACGLVVWTPLKNSHVYRHTERVRTWRQGDTLQMVILNDAGRWMLLNLDETADPSQVVPPPACFIDTRADQH